jgi:hypothetical protein
VVDIDCSGPVRGGRALADPGAPGAEAGSRKRSVRTMATQAHIRDTQAAGDRMPAGVRWALLAVVGALLAGALYLIAVRGEALLVDLSTLSRIFCF